MADAQGGYERLGSQAEAPRVVVNPLHQQPLPPAERKPRDKHKSTLYGLGVAEIVLGSISMLLAIITMIIAQTGDSDWYVNLARSITYSAQGLWGGLLLTITGLLGVKAKGNPSVCMFSTNMAMSIITAIIAPVVVIMSGIASAYCAYSLSLLAIHAIIAVLAFTAFVICIVHSAYCCAGVCCHHKSSQGAVTYIPQQHYIVPPTQQMVQLPSGHVMMVPSQPMVSPSYPGNAPTTVGNQVMLQPSQIGVGSPPMTLPPQAPMQQPALAYAGAIPTQQTAQAVAKDQQPAGNPPEYRA